MLSALTSAMKTFLTTVDKNINKSINKLTQVVTTLIFQNAKKFAREGCSTRVRNRDDLDSSNSKCDEDDDRLTVHESGRTANTLPQRS